MALARPEIRSKLIIIEQEIDELRYKVYLLREKHLQAMLERELTGDNDNSSPRECAERMSKSFHRIKRATIKKQMTSRMRIDVPYN